MPSHLTKNYGNALPGLQCFMPQNATATINSCTPNGPYTASSMHLREEECVLVIPVMFHGTDLVAACPCLLLSGSRSPTVLLQPLPKWLGLVGAANRRLARLVVKVEQPCPSHTAVPDQSDQHVPIMSRLEPKFAG